MTEQLPLEINPFALADKGVTLEGELPVSAFTRLADVLASTEGMVQVRLKFGRDEYGPRTITGQISGTLSLICQRCGEPFGYDINTMPCLSPVINDSQAKSLAKEYEPWITAGEAVQLVDLVEEEILLSLPMFPKHELGECPKDVSDVLK